MTTQEEWTRKYKYALLQRNPVRQITCIQNARDAMLTRMGQLQEASSERRAITRALGVLANIPPPRSTPGL